MRTAAIHFLVPLFSVFLISGSCIKPEKNDPDDNNHSNIDEVDLGESLVAHWLYNETDTLARDKSGNDHNGTIYGDPSDYDGFASAFNFDGKDDYISIPAEGSRPPKEISDLKTGSISLWFKVDSIPLADGIMPVFSFGSKNNCLNMFDASNQGIVIEVGHSPVHWQSKRLYFTLFMNGCRLPSLCYDSNFDLEEGSWYHFVAIVGKDYNTGYLNGKELSDRCYNFGNSSSREFFYDSPAKEALYIGKGYWDERTVYFKGQIDDIRIYDKDINHAEVNYLYSLRLSGPASER